jgi:release factor glutamine methyltransferase
MRTTVQYIVSKTYRPLLVRYLSRSRGYTWKGIAVEVFPGVFHPGFFFSTKLLLGLLQKRVLVGKKVLELGAGSGLLSIFAAKKKAVVMASDISSTAIACLEKNREANDAHFEIRSSDLFESIPPQIFDLILINPPYYRKKPATDGEYAWYCGEHGEYFQRLFHQLNEYIHENTETLMVLCDGCDIESITKFAGENDLSLHCILKVNKIIEYNYVFKICRNIAG